MFVGLGIIARFFFNIIYCHLYILNESRNVLSAQFLKIESNVLALSNATFKKFLRFKRRPRLFSNSQIFLSLEFFELFLKKKINFSDTMNLICFQG